MFDYPIAAGAMIAVAGGGGKTSLIELMERDLASLPALVTVTTRLGRRQLPHLPRVRAGSLGEAAEAVREASAGKRLLLSGPPPADDPESDHLHGVPTGWLAKLRPLAAPELVWLIEADGSAGRPVKAHRPDEPVLPPRPFDLIMVIGLSALVTPWTEAVHRPERFRLATATPKTARPLTPEEIADFALKAYAPMGPDLILLNQSDALPPERRELGERLAEALRAAGFKVAVDSLQERLAAGTSQGPAA